MNIMISSHGNNLQSQPNLRFGRTPFFIRFNLEDETWEAFDNPGVNESGGAGVAAAQLLIDKKISTALSGRFGPNATQALSAANIQMVTFTPKYGTIQEVIDAYKAKELNEGSINQ